MASRAFSLGLRAALCAGALTMPATAEVTVDGSLGTPAGSVTGGLLPDGRAVDYLIGPELGAQRGANLFHSFGAFSIEAGRVGAFTGPAEVQNVVARVTGGAQSRIDGTLRSVIPGANLFLVNPSGVVFGETAVLDVQGSFYTSTADEVRLGDGEVYSARTPGGPPLSVAPPESFGFVSTDPAGIEVNLPPIPLRGPVNATLAFVGGDVVMQGSGERTGYLWAPAGPIHLVAVASDGSGTVRVGIAPVDGALDVSGPVVGRAIEIRRDAFLTSSNLHPVFTGSVGGRGGGDVLVFAGDLLIENAEVHAETVGRDPGGDVRIDLGGDLVVRKLEGGNTGIVAGTGVDLGNGFIIALGGDGGTIVVDARRVLLEGGATLSTSSVFIGRPGEISITASDSVTVRGRDAAGLRSGVFSNTSGAEGALIRVATPLLLMQDGGGIVAQTRGFGRGGDIEIEVGRLVLESTARIDSSTRSFAVPAVDGGNIRVTATESVSISGRESDTEFSGITTIAQPESTGDGGTILATAPVVLIFDGGEISAKALGAGDAGQVVIEADRIFESREGFVTTASENGSGGQIEIRALERVYLRNSEVSTSVRDGSGGGGDLSIDPEIVILDSSRVIAQADEGAGGNIAIVAGNFVATPDSLVDASSNTGVSGQTNVESVDAELGKELRVQAPSYADPSALLRDSCASRASRASTFLVVPHDRAPAPPDAPLEGPLDPPPGCEAP
jgi:filamentous hemagglutinin family protein